MEADLLRLQNGEPLAYVIGTQPFLGLTIHLDTRPLIPRPETEWWVEMLIQNITAKDLTKPYRILDLCSGSGAIGCALLQALPNATVTFAEIDPVHVPLIKKNILANGLPLERTHVVVSDVWSGLTGETFDIIATNPPYIRTDRILEKSVTNFEPSRALFAGEDGLTVIREILKGSSEHLKEEGVLWLECDSEHADDVLALANKYTHSPTLHRDLYERPRLLVSYR